MSTVMMLIRSCSLALCTAAAMAFALGPVRAETIDFGRYYALVIGNDKYEHWTRLTTAVRDARDVADILDRQYGFKVKFLPNAKSREIVRALNELRSELTEDDSLLIYYAGHGQLDGEDGFWIGVDGDKNFEDSWIPVSTITRNLNHMSARHVLVVADSCYSGTLTRGDDDAGLRTGRERSAWLMRMTNKRARLALTSGGLEPVSDIGGGNHSVFAKQFLDALRENDQVLDGHTLFDRIKEDVVANADQTPDYGKIRMANDDGGDFLFVPRGLQVAALFEQQETLGPKREAGEYLGQDFQVWSLIKDSADPTDLDTFIATFPASVWVVFAQRRLDLMRAGERDTAALTKSEGASAETETAEAPDPAAIEAALGLSPRDREAIQASLTALGFDTKGADGVLGPNSRRAIAAWQQARNERPTGYLTASQYDRLLAEVQPKLALLESSRKAEQTTQVQPAVGIYEYQPGDVFQDCPECPEMVVVPAGEFMMGSPPDEPRHYDDQLPQHKVTIPRPFAAGKYEVTFAEWDACVADGGCGTSPDDNGWGRGNRPVIKVNWNDAQEYVAWLTRKTRKSYRLLSEAEWEYVARAGSSKAYWWGEEVVCGNAHWVGCDNPWGRRTAPVGSYAANSFGLHDTAGNVDEWVEDCGPRHDGVPDCYERMVRGGTLFGIAYFMRSAFRYPFPSYFRTEALGFRVARTID